MIVLKGIPSTYNKDMQEDKEALFDTVDTLEMVLPVLTGVIETLTIHPEKMAASLDDAMLATDMADYLVEKGVPFREAHHLVGEVIRLAESEARKLSSVPVESLQHISPHFEQDIVTIFDFKHSVSKRQVIGGTAPSAVRQQIEEAKKRSA